MIMFNPIIDIITKKVTTRKNKYKSSVNIPGYVFHDVIVTPKENVKFLSETEIQIIDPTSPDIIKTRVKTGNGDGNISLPLDFIGREVVIIIFDRN